MTVQTSLSSRKNDGDGNGKGQVNASFPQSLPPGGLRNHRSQSPVGRPEVRQTYHWYRDKRLGDILKKLDIHESVGPGRMQPQVLRKLTEVPAKPVLIVFGSSWQLREVPED